MPVNIRTTNLSFYYEKHVPVLRNINLEIESGEIFVISGQCGCGKSTLIKLMTGLLRPTLGAVELQGKNLQEISPGELYCLRQNIGFLFQNSALISNMSTYKNIELPASYHLNYGPEELRALVEELIRKVGLFGYESRMPADLSTGQRKRAAVARALALNPELMFYDEPTAGLDPINAQGIADIIRDRFEEHETTSVVITHDMPFAISIASRIAVMYRGRIIFTGVPSELVASDDPYIREFLGPVSKAA